MTISQIAIRRIVEGKAEEDEAYRRQLQQNGWRLSCQVREMSDDQLVAELQIMGIEIDRVTLDRESQAYLAAYQLANTLLDGRQCERPVSDQDGAWFAIETLWRRWFPERPNLEFVDDCMQEGYAAAARQDRATACRQWRQAWRAILDLMRKFRIETIADFDDQFGGSQSVFNWVQDYESELHNAGLDDPQFFRERITLCQAALERLGDEEHTVQNFRSALAASHIELGERDIGDRLFRQWLAVDPQWGWGWISWSDCHFLFAAGTKDFDRALQILHEGLAVTGVRDRKFILSRLESVLAEAGREDEAADVHRQWEQAEEDVANRRGDPKSPPARPHGEDLFGDRQRVGRNDQCPCGSGKKYKKCCRRCS